ncbi:MAG: hypothetical protein ACT4OO_02360 [Nitrospiraceae bacterium]
MSGYTDEILKPVIGQDLAFIQKPFTGEVLVRKIRETLTGISGGAG